MKRLIAIITVIFLTGCSLETVRVKETPDVVVSIPPYVFLVQDIVGSTLSVSALLGANFDPHSAEVTPRQMKMVQNAHLFVGVGEAYEQKLLSVIGEEAKGVHILKMNERIPLLSYPEDTHFVHTCHAQSTDLHFWLGPKSLISQVEVLIDALCQLKPEHQKMYQENGKALIKKIQNLDQQLENKLRPYEGRAIVVSHAALGYFCHDYNLIQIAVECEGKSPLPQNISYAFDLARRYEAICSFIAPQFDNKGAEAVGKALHLRIVSFDPLSENIFETFEDLGNAITE